jgi:hypothetical protein
MPAADVPSPDAERARRRRREERRLMMEACRQAFAAEQDRLEAHKKDVHDLYRQPKEVDR